MRLAVISDIHGNLTALDAVIADLKQTTPDQVLHAGDLVASGCRPLEVLDRIRNLGWNGVLGNTDEMLWAPERITDMKARAPKLRPLLDLFLESIVPATVELIGPESLAWLQQLPKEWRIESLLITHAAPGDLWEAPMPDASDQELLGTYSDLKAGIVVYGHIHRPYVRFLPSLTVANAGSVGLPYDGDTRASYVLIDNGKPNIRRIEYDLEREVVTLLGSGYPCASWLAEILRRGRYVAP